MERSRLCFRALLVCLVAVFLSSAAHAQYRASIQGVVTDPQGSTVSGATVTLTNDETGQKLTATTNDGGVYNFNGLPPSKFTVTVEKQGFKTKTVKGFGVIAEQANALNVQLEIGQATESVTVNGDAAPLIDTETANVSGTVTAKQIQALPSYGRDVFQLLQLAPGAFGDGAQAAGGGTANLPGTTIGGTGGTDGSFKIENSGQITANGARNGENNYQIDGVATNSVTWGASVITPNEDSVKEVKIITDNYDAENGRFRGAQIQVISQNGTNDLHGSLYLKVHRPGLNAFTKYNGPGNGNVRDQSRFNDWGGSAGGPILKNRLFGFFSYEDLGNKAKQQSGGGWYETPEFRALTAAAPNAAAFFAFPGNAPNGGTQVDHDCAFVNLIEGTNCHFIPGKGLNLGSPLTAGVGVRDAGFVSSSSPGTGGDGSGSAANLSNVPDILFLQGTLEPTDSSHKQYNGRVDFNATKNDLIGFSFYYVPNTSLGQNGNGDRAANSMNFKSANRAATVIWDHTFGSTLVNEARVNASGWMEKDQGSTFNPQSPFGLPSVGITGPGNTGLNGFGVGNGNYFDQWTYAGKDVLTKIRGAHTMKMGGEFSRLLSVDYPTWNSRPSFNFNNIWDFLNDAPSSESVVSDPSTGVPNGFRRDVRSNIIGLFFQDNYKVRPNLTVTAGLRWEYFGPISEKNNRLGIVELGTGTNLFTGIKTRTTGGQSNAQKTNFGPQLGFAWSPARLVGHELNSRLVLRGGIGIAFNNTLQSNTLDARDNPPFSQSNNFSGGDITVGGQICYIGCLPSDPKSVNGYGSNPNAISPRGPDGLPTSGAPVNVVAFPATLPTVYTYHYTFGGEYDLGHQWVASIGYQGSSTRHQTVHYNLYDVGAGMGLAFNPKIAGVTYYANDGSAHFNAMLLELKHNFSQTFSVDTQYRLSHGVDSGSNAYAGGFYQFDKGTDLATSDYDVKHAFKVFGVYSPTIFKGSHSWLEKVAGGWSLSGILNAHTGFPWTPQYRLNNFPGGLAGDPVYSLGSGAGFGGAGGSTGNAGNGSLLPAAYLGGFNPNFRNDQPVDATGLFTPPTVTAGTLFECLFPGPVTANCPLGGNQPLGALPTKPGIARNSFRGPGYFGIDAQLSKSFGLPTMKVIGENAKLEFRANFYNLFNKLNLNQGSCDGWGGMCDITSAHFGEAPSAFGARVIEMQARFSF